MSRSEPYGTIVEPAAVPFAPPVTGLRVVDDAMFALIQQALRDADTSGDGSLYAQSPGQLPDHVHNRVARIIEERVLVDYRGALSLAEYQRDDAQRTHDRREDRIVTMRREVTRLRAALTDIAAEDWRGPKPRAIGIAEAALEATSG